MDICKQYMKTVRTVSLITVDEPTISHAYVMKMIHGFFTEKKSILDIIK